MSTEFSEENELQEQIEELLSEAVTSAINSAALTIQTAVGSKEGDVAGVFFSEEPCAAFRQTLRSYLQAELVLLANAGTPVKRLLMVNDTAQMEFVYHGVAILDPTISECGRFVMDPVKDYGLLPGQLRLMEDFNGPFFVGK